MLNSKIGIVPLFLSMPLFIALTGVGFFLGVFYLPPQILVVFGVISGYLIWILKPDEEFSLIALLLWNGTFSHFIPMIIFITVFIFSGTLRIIRAPIRLLRGRPRRSSPALSSRLQDQVGSLILFAPESGVFPVPFYAIVDPLFEPIILLTIETWIYYITFSSLTILVMSKFDE